MDKIKYTTFSAHENPVYRAYREIMGKDGVSKSVVEGLHETHIIAVDHSDPAFKTRVKEMVAVLTPAFMENKTREFWDTPNNAHVQARHCMYVALMRHANMNIPTDPLLEPVSTMAHTAHLNGGDYYGEDYKVALAILNRAGEIQSAQKKGTGKIEAFKDKDAFEKYCDHIPKLTAFRGVAMEGEKVLNEAFMTDPKKPFIAKEDKAAQNKVTAIIAAFDVATHEAPKPQVAKPALKPFDLSFGMLQQNAPFDFSKTPAPVHKPADKPVVTATTKAVTYTTREGDTFFDISKSKEAASALATVKTLLGEGSTSKDATLALSLIISSKNLELSRSTARKGDVVDADYVPCCGTKLVMPTVEEVIRGITSLKKGILQDGKISYSREMKHQQVEDLVSLTGAKPTGHQR